MVLHKHTQTMNDVKFFPHFPHEPTFIVDPYQRPKGKTPNRHTTFGGKGP